MLRCVQQRLSSSVCLLCAAVQVEYVGLFLLLAALPAEAEQQSRGADS